MCPKLVDAAIEAIQPMRALPQMRWDRVADVVVVGFGAAGVAAAIEAARAGADTLVVERATRGGGAAALSGGLIYLGGGTRVQRNCGFADSPEEMERHVLLAAGRRADPAKVHAYCDGSVEHFDWLCDLGVGFKDAYVEERVTVPQTDDCLLYTGNERVHPFAEMARPVPRGHKPRREGDAGGYLMETMMDAADASGTRIIGDCRAEQLVVDHTGRVIGIRVQCAGEALLIGARRGIVLATGGFIMNREMVGTYAPELTACNYPLGTDGDDGRGIRMGQGVGGAVDNMDEGLVLNAYYPPSAHLKGVMINAAGRRFINEDAYIGRTSDAILYGQSGRAWLVVDDELYGRTQASHKIAAIAETFGELEAELSIPAGDLVATLERYNHFAEAGEDPDHHKSAEYLRPLSAPPFAALDCTTQGSIYGVFTLGGLRTLSTGEVTDEAGKSVAGLYAAGRCTAGLPLEGRTYASGLSIGGATFFGRRAGRSAALAPDGLLAGE